MRLIDLDKAMSICDEDNNTVIFANIENAEVKAIPIEWLYQKRTLYLENECYMSLMVINEILNWWEKENGKSSNRD